MKRLLPFVTAFFLACGARPPAPVDVDDEPLPPAGDRPALQLYLVLTNDATAMQDEASVAAMWDAVHGRTARYQPIFKHVTWAPPGYELTVDLDFADLPHPALDPKAIEAIVATLPEAAQAKARAAKFGVIFQSDAAVLPGGAHIRLAGTAALYAADRYDGVVLDLLARRGWTPDAWLAELAAPELSAQQLRLVKRNEADGRLTLLSQGHPKYGVPDLRMGGVAASGAQAAEARFLAVQASLLARGGAPGERLPTPVGAVTLGVCPKAGYDRGCVEVSAK